MHLVTKQAYSSRWMLSQLSIVVKTQGVTAVFQPTIVCRNKSQQYKNNTGKMTCYLFVHFTYIYTAFDILKINFSNSPFWLWSKSSHYLFASGTNIQLLLQNLKTLR